MARGAILGGVPLAMAGETCAHIMSDDAFRHGGFSQISMAGGTGNPGAIMRRVAKLHMRFGRKTVHALPGDLLFLICVFNHLFHFGLFPCQFCMAEHALLDGWNAGRGSDVGTGMTIDAGHAQFHMCVVRKQDRLLLREGGNRA